MTAASALIHSIERIDRKIRLELMWDATLTVTRLAERIMSLQTPN